MKWETNEKPEKQRLPHEPTHWLIGDDHRVKAWIVRDEAGWWWATFEGVKSSGPFETLLAAQTAAEMLL